MEFKRLPSYVNHNHKNLVRFFSENPDLHDKKFVVTEKIHGANFQIFTDGQRIRFASRNKFLNPTDKFFGFRGDEHLIRNLGEAVFLKARRDNCKIQLVGEYFGNGVQREIDYGEYRSFRFFSMFIDDKKISFKDFKDFMVSIKQGPMMVPILGYISFKDVFDYKNDHLTRIKPVAGNVAEGIVAEPFDEVVMFDGGSPLVIKSKNDLFSEVHKAPKGSKTIDPNLVRVNAEFLRYITKARLDNVISKLGPLERNDQIGEYIAALKKDAIEDFMSDRTDLGPIDDKTGKQLFNIHKEGFKLVREHLDAGMR